MKVGPDAFFARIGRNAVVRTAFVPGAAHLVQRLCQNHEVLGLGKISNVPLHFLSPMVGVAFGAIRGLIPN